MANINLGKYELHEVIGKGGFGTVYRAVDLSLEREVAVKILHAQLTVDTDFVERFRREARLMAKLEHAMPAYALKNSYAGDGLDDTWSAPYHRSSFIGTFQVTAE